MTTMGGYSEVRVYRPDGTLKGVVERDVLRQRGELECGINGPGKRVQLHLKAERVWQIVCRVCGKQAHVKAGFKPTLCSADCRRQAGLQRGRAWRLKQKQAKRLCQVCERVMPAHKRANAKRCGRWECEDKANTERRKQA